ncbi:unnamed protein product [Polarella glacialis]|uniref:Uncharacterized protein n=1 Tax=Polarella glacialis TaxID=89957 RepID=A0A813JPW3_POLGL|nr:unnamed protein product [Polarella glacialis]CAE8685702.1 unnamed protein product [Polarella glacialis]
MPWGGGTTKGLGGNPGSISRFAGDLPGGGESGNSGAGGLNLTAVLMGRGARASQGRSARAAQAPQAASLPTDWKLPDWIQPDAHVCYLSRSTGGKLEVVIEMVNSAKNEVEISNAAGGGWRVIPFTLIASAMNPLFPPSALPPAAGPSLPAPVSVEAPEDLTEEQGSSAAADPTEKAPSPQGPANRCVDLTDERERSRSPKR